MSIAVIPCVNNGMHTHFSDHPVFKDFKGRRVRSSATVVFPGGAGGNFLSSQMVGTHSAKNGVNEHYSNSQWLYLDDSIPYDSSGNAVVNLDSIYRICADTSENFLPKRIKISHSHKPPMMLHLTHDFETDEIICIEPGLDTAWFVSALCQSKNALGTSYKEAASLMSNILSNNRYVGVVTSEEYTRMVFTLSDALMMSSEILMSTPLTWMWLLDAKYRDADPMDREGFSVFATELIFSAALCDIAGQKNIVTKKQLDPYYKDAIEYLGNVSKITIVDYGSAFVDLKPIDGEYGSMVSKDAMSAYTSGNISLILSLIPMVSSEHRDHVASKAYGLRSRLAAAI